MYTSAATATTTSSCSSSRAVSRISKFIQVSSKLRRDWAMHISSFLSLQALTSPRSLDPSDARHKVHLRVQQRGNRQYITSIEGLPTDLNLELIKQALRRKCNCNGGVRRSWMDSEESSVINLAGDQRMKVRSFLVEEGVCYEHEIVIHGW